MTFRSPQQMVDMTEPAILVKSNSNTVPAITVMKLSLVNNPGEGRLFGSGL